MGFSMETIIFYGKKYTEHLFTFLTAVVNIYLNLRCVSILRLLIELSTLKIYKHRNNAHEMRSRFIHFRRMHFDYR